MEMETTLEELATGGAVLGIGTTIEEDGVGMAVG